MMISGTLRSVALVGGFIAVLGLAIYPVIIDPKLHPEKYRNKQKWIRDKIPLEETQPGGMRVWSDPFQRKKSPDEENK